MIDEDLKMIEVQHKIEVDNEDHKVANQIELETFKSCCFEIRKDFFLLISKLIISIIVLILCIFQLITDKNRDIQTLYSSLIGLIVGSYLKN